MATPKKHHEPRKCKNPSCGKIFVPKRDDQLYCSPRCYNAWYQRVNVRKSKPKQKKAINIDPKRGLHEIKCDTCEKMFMPTSRTQKNCPECRALNKRYKHKNDTDASGTREERIRRREADKKGMEQWAYVLHIDFGANYGTIRHYYDADDFSGLQRRVPSLVPARTTT